GTVQNEGGIGTNEPIRIDSLDHNAGIHSGFRVFMDSEKRILAIENAKLEIANTGLLKNQKLDVPTLVFYLQLQYNLADESKSRSQAEEVNQTNSLLKTYAAMQRIVNQTEGKFDTSNQNQKLGWKGLAGGAAVPITDPDFTATAMFEDFLSGGANFQAHPLETL